MKWRAHIKICNTDVLIIDAEDSQEAWNKAHDLKFEMELELEPNGWIEVINVEEINEKDNYPISTQL